MILIKSKEEQELIKHLRKLNGSLPEKLQELANVREEIANAKIEKERLEENHAKQERELRHMIGLEKKRQEFEIKQAREETSLRVRESNLNAEKTRFEENLKFNTDRFEKMESYLKDMMKSILERLPNVNMQIGKK